jgi:hypothetical protein
MSDGLESLGRFRDRARGFAVVPPTSNRYFLPTSSGNRPVLFSLNTRTVGVRSPSSVSSTWYAVEVAHRSLRGHARFHHSSQGVFLRPPIAASVSRFSRGSQGEPTLSAGTATVVTLRRNSYCVLPVALISPLLTSQKPVAQSRVGPTRTSSYRSGRLVPFRCSGRNAAHRWACVGKSRARAARRVEEGRARRDTARQATTRAVYGAAPRWGER